MDNGRVLLYFVSVSTLVGGSPMVDRQVNKSSIAGEAGAEITSERRKKEWTSPSLKRLDGRSASPAFGVASGPVSPRSS
jgi:hypothetical protein